MMIKDVCYIYVTAVAAITAAHLITGAAPDRSERQQHAHPRVGRDRALPLPDVCPLSETGGRISTVSRAHLDLSRSSPLCISLARSEYSSVAPSPVFVIRQRARGACTLQQPSVSPGETARWKLAARTTGLATLHPGCTPCGPEWTGPAACGPWHSEHIVSMHHGALGLGVCSRQPIVH